MQRQRFQDRQSKDDTPVETVYCSCMWRKPQTRKNKTWDGDGILYIRGASCVLKCRETGQEISSGSLASGWVPEPGKELSVGGKDIEIDEVMTREQIERELSSTFAEPARLLEIATHPKPAKSFKPPMMTASQSRIAPTASTYRGKIAIKPLVNRPFCPPARAENSTRVEDNQDIELTKNSTVSSTYLASKKRRRSDTDHIEVQPTTNTDQLELKDQTGPLYFVCLYRKMQALQSSKTSTWGDDGFLVLYPSSSGCMAVLKDSVKGKTLGSMMLGLQTEVRPGVQLKVGGRQLEIQRQADAGEIEFLESGQSREDESGWSDIVKKDETVLPFTTPVRSVETSLPKKTFKSRFDPNVPGAVVLPRPDADWLIRLNPKNIPLVDVVVDPLISRFLRPHQVEGVKFMYECTMGMRGHEAQGCVLADEMGLGKSIQAIALLWTLLRQNPLGGQGPVIQRAMIVCPVTLVKNWAREMNKWLGRSRLNMFVADGKSNIKHFTSSPYYNIIIIGYERLRTLSQEINVVYPPIGLIIADEGHRLKSIEAKTTQALRTLKTQRRVVLSGTPIQNNLNEYYAMVDFVNPGILSDLKSFKKKFEQPIAKSREPGSTPSQKALGRSRAEELAELSDSYVLRRGSDVISHHLPPRHDYCLFIDLAAAQKKIYAATLASPEIRAVFSGESSQQLVLINTLKKLCNSAGLLMNETSIQNLAKNSSTLFPSWVTRNDIKLSGKMIALASFLKILHEKTDEKIILVSNFTSTLDVIEAHCRSQNYSLCRLDGKTPQNKRDDIVQTFNRMTARSQFVFLLSSKSGGVGLNLIGASRLILFDSDWNPATDLQAMARIWRQGQKKACHIYRFLATGTIDECIFQRQVTKTGLATDLIKDAGVSREVLDRGNTFTSDELKRLFELHTGTPCHTHDLLGCRCFETKTTDEVAEDAAGQAESDSDSLPEASQMFQPATQYKPSNLQKEPKKLAELETWDHINTSLSDSLEELDDSILYDTIVDLKSKHVESDDEDEDSNENVRSTTKGGEITFVFHKTNTILGSTANSDVEVQCV